MTKGLPIRSAPSIIQIHPFRQVTAQQTLAASISMFLLFECIDVASSLNNEKESCHLHSIVQIERHVY